MFEPHFYGEVLSVPRRKIIHYFLTLLVFFSLLISGAHTFYFFNGRNSLPKTLAAAFPGMAIHDGVLHPPSDTSYIPPSYLIASALNQLLYLPVILNEEVDSLVVVDTSNDSVVSRKLPMFHLKAREMVVHLNTDKSMTFSYENIMYGNKDLVFTQEQLGLFFRRHLAGIFFVYFFSTIVHQGVVIFFSIFFLGTAAYIFRLDRRRTFREYLKVSTFAIAPVAVGSALIAFSGVKVGWSWNILILLSTVVMFRAILATGGGKVPRE